MSRYFYSIVLIAISLCFTLDASSSCKRGCKPCGKLSKHGCKVKKGCVKIPSRVQDYFQGAEECSTFQEEVPCAKIFYRKKGKQACGNPTIVFVHGFGETSDAWKCAQSELSDCYCTVAMDLRGYGRSSLTPAFPQPNGIHYTADLFAEDIHQLLSHLGICDNIVMVAHSLGANVALKYVADHPEQIVKLVLVGALPYFIPDCAVEEGCESECFNPATCQENFCYPFGITATQGEALFGPLVSCLEGGGSEEECLIEFGEAIAPLWYNEPCQDELQKAQESLVSAVASNTVAIDLSFAANALTEDFRLLLPNIQVPTLITYGSDDIIINPGNSHFIHDNLANSVLAEFVGHGHQSHVTDYKNFNRLLRTFIRSCDLPDFIKVFDQGCCVCPLLGPVDYHSCDD